MTTQTLASKAGAGGPVTFRPALREDSRTMAELFRISAGGVADYIWSKLARPGESLLDVGARRYARVGAPFSYENATLVECDGRIVGMMHAFEITPRAEDERETDPVLAPMAELEIPGSLYLASLALYPEYRNRGIGSGLFALARECARAEGLELLSSLVVEENRGSLRLHRRQGFEVVDRHPIVPHPMIGYSGDVLLLKAPVS